MAQRVLHRQCVAGASARRPRNAVAAACGRCAVVRRRVLGVRTAQARARRFDHRRRVPWPGRWPVQRDPGAAGGSGARAWHRGRVDRWFQPRRRRRALCHCPGVRITTFFHNCEARFFLDAFRRRPTPHAAGVLLANARAERMAVGAATGWPASMRATDATRPLARARADALLPMALRDLWRGEEPMHPGTRTPTRCSSAAISTRIGTGSNGSPDGSRRARRSGSLWWARAWNDMRFASNGTAMSKSSAKSTTSRPGTWARVSWLRRSSVVQG